MSNAQVITVTNEYGKEEKLEVIDIINLEQNQYAIVSPVGSDVAYAYKMFKKGNEIEYKSIGQGKEFNTVLEKYNSMQDK
jgi:uncharacterized protein YrzB (UPF0473 family)